MIKVTFINCDGGISVVTCGTVDYSDEKYLVCKETVNGSIQIKALIPHSKVCHIMPIKD